LGDALEPEALESNREGNALGARARRAGDENGGKDHHRPEHPERAQ
jgi:hypothetical protein